MHKFPLALLCTTTALVSTEAARAQATMTPLAGFGVNGWIAPGSTPYLTTGNTERGISYNPATGNVLVVARQNVGGVSNNVHVIDGATGAGLYQLDNTGISGGTFAINMVDVDASGAIYACNLSTSAGSAFKVYKWDDEVLGQTTPPTVAYDAISGVTRTGDSFAVTGGSGGNPAQFAAAGSNNISASNFVVGPLDGSNASTAYLSVPGTGTASNDYRLSLTFIDQNTLIGNQGGLARLTSFAGGTATLAASIPLGSSARRGMDYAVIGNTPVLAVIDTNSSTVAVFDITDPTAPIELASANATTGTLSGNINGAGAVAWGTISGTSATLYAMSTNQGIQAFTVDLSPLAGASSYGTGCDGLGLNAGGGLPTLGNSAFELTVTNVPAISPLAFVGFGTVVVNPGVPLDSAGMAGCFAYTNLDLGVLGAGAIVGGNAPFPLPIPVDLTLPGTVLSSQAISFSLATALGLASSNGVEIVIGF